MRNLFLLVLLLVLPVPVFAQTSTPALPNSVDILVLPATGDPVTIAPLATRNTVIAAATNCNLPASATGPTPLVNPTIGEFDDPFTSGRVCRVPMPVGLPNGTGYRGVAVFIANNCEVGGVPTTNCRSPRSAVAVPPFNIQPILIPPVAPTNPVIRP